MLTGVLKEKLAQALVYLCKFGLFSNRHVL